MFSMPLLAGAGGFPCFFALLFKILEGFRKAQQDFGACFKKCLSFGIGDLGHGLSVCFKFLRVMAMDRSRRTAYNRAFGLLKSRTVMTHCHRILTAAPRQNHTGLYRRGPRRRAEMNFLTYSVSIYEVLSLGQPFPLIIGCWYGRICFRAHPQH
jgi:hypothetical protein